MTGVKLFEALQTNQTISMISIPCPCGDDVGRALRSLLLSNVTLTELDLHMGDDWAGFSHRGMTADEASEINQVCKHVFEALETNSSLSSLSLPCGNPKFELDDEISEALDALNKSLKANTSLKTLKANVMADSAALAVESAQKLVSRNRVKWFMVSCAEVEPGEIVCSTIAGTEVGKFSVPIGQPPFADWLASKILEVRPLEVEEQLQLISRDGIVLWPPKEASD